MLWNKMKHHVHVIMKIMVTVVRIIFMKMGIGRNLNEIFMENRESNQS